MARKKIHGKSAANVNGRWGFLNNHARVFLLIAADPLILQREAANRLAITERAVQRIVAELEKAGYLTRQRAGRSNRYELKLDEPLRDDHCGHVSLRQFIRLLQSDSRDGKGK